MGAIAADAWDLGATELCVQGLLPDDADPLGYLDIVRAAKAAVMMALLRSAASFGVRPTISKSSPVNPRVV